jgi:hypothetical protein
MTTFEQRYSETLASLGRPLRRVDRLPEKEIKKAEARLKVTIPDALRAFYRTAGRATDFTQACDRFLYPNRWSVEGEYLVFAEENQAVVLYSIRLSQSPVADPPVFMSANGDSFRWYTVCASVSEFISVYMLWHGTSGAAMRCGGEALASKSTATRLRRNWSYVGEVNKMRAYSQHGRAACYVKWSDGWRVFIGAHTDEDLAAVADELAIQPDVIRHSEDEEGTRIIEHKGQVLRLSKWQNRRGRQGWRLEPLTGEQSRPSE